MWIVIEEKTMNSKKKKEVLIEKISLQRKILVKDCQQTLEFKPNCLGETLAQVWLVWIKQEFDSN